VRPGSTALDWHIVMNVCLLCLRNNIIYLFTYLRRVIDKLVYFAARQLWSWSWFNPRPCECTPTPLL